MTLRAFEIHVPESVLADLKQRLALTRWPDEIPDSGWDYGTNLDYLKQLVAYWQETFDWRAQERLLNTFPQFKLEVDGMGVHFVYVRGKGPQPIPLLISHGWPGSFFEMYKIIWPLADPASHGGDPQDAFDVIVPSFPGYGFSDRTRERGVDVARIAEVFMRLMTAELGYERFGAQGGDWGSAIASRLGHAYPDKLIGIHLNAVFVPPDPQQGKLTAEGQKWREQWQKFQIDGSGYFRLQSTRPQTLAYSLNDSPVGLAGWIVEKFRDWSDCQGEIERAFTKDELLTNIMIYWVTETINASTRLYYEASHHGSLAPERVDVPTGAALFPKELITPPRAAAERRYNIQQWTPMAAGGHFAALEQPEALVRDIRTFFRLLRHVSPSP